MSGALSAVMTRKTIVALTAALALLGSAAAAQAAPPRPILDARGQMLPNATTNLTDNVSVECAAAEPLGFASILSCYLVGDDGIRYDESSSHYAGTNGVATAVSVFTGIPAQGYHPCVEASWVVVLDIENSGSGVDTYCNPN